MYRLSRNLSLAFVCSLNAFTVAQESDPESSRLDVASTLNCNDAEIPFLEFAFLEEMLPASQRADSNTRLGLDAGLGVIDFDQLFTEFSDSDRDSVVFAPVSHEESAPSPNSPSAPVAVARIPSGLSSDASRSNPVSHGPVPAPSHPVLTPAVDSSVIAQKPSKEVVDPSAGEATGVEPEASPSVGSGVQTTAAIEEIQNFALEEVVVLNSDTGAIQPDAIAATNIEQAAICASCNSTTQCQCRPKKSQWSCLTDWWHSTSLHRHHVQAVGQPGLFCERPFGVCNEGFAAAMIVAGKEDRSMLHHYDFTHYPDGAIELSQRGHRELDRIVRTMAQFPVTLSIEATLNHAEDAARRNAVLTAIAQSGLPVSPESVLVTEDHSVGLSGVDAQAIHSIRINEVLTGASRTRIYPNSPGATVIPYATGDGSPQQ